MFKNENHEEVRKLIDKLEKKFGKYAIKGLMKYVLVLYAAGFLIELINPSIYYEYLMLDIDKLLHGQVWRLFTFIIQSPSSSNIIWVFFAMLCCYFIGNTLENMWGSFRFNLYYFSGVLFNILAGIIFYVIAWIALGTGISYPITLDYLNMSLFLAFALSFPDQYFTLYFIIPIKAKYMAILYAVIIGYDIYEAFQYGSTIALIGTVTGTASYPGWMSGVGASLAVVVSIANFIIFFFANRKSMISGLKRKREYRRSVRNGERARRAGFGTRDTIFKNTEDENAVEFPKERTQRNNTVTKHKCAVCGRTELDDYNLEFRFCSKCNGNYEYCMEHLFTHTHVQ